MPLPISAAPPAAASGKPGLLALREELSQAIQGNDAANAARLFPSADWPATRGTRFPRGKGVSIEHPFFEAVYADRPDCLRAMLSACADPGRVARGCRDENGMSIAKLATLKNHDCLVAVAPHVDLRERDTNGQTLLMLAAQRGASDTVAFLAPLSDVNALVAKEDGEARSALILAAGEGHAECLKILLATEGIDPHKAEFPEFASRDAPCTAVDAAILLQKPECLRLLMPFGLPKLPEGFVSPLMRAATKQSVECAEILLPRLGVADLLAVYDPEIEGDARPTALIYALGEMNLQACWPIADAIVARMMELDCFAPEHQAMLDTAIFKAARQRHPQPCMPRTEALREARELRAVFDANSESGATAEANRRNAMRM